MSSGEQLNALLAAADEALPDYRKKRPGKWLTDQQAEGVRLLGRFWLAFDEKKYKTER